jgi:hypothetical protein
LGDAWWLQWIGFDEVMFIFGEEMMVVARLVGSNTSKRLKRKRKGWYLC